MLRVLCSGPSAIQCISTEVCRLLQVSSDESARLIKMEETLHGRVIGQEEAVVAISRAIRRARVGLKSPNRPIASFIFSGVLCHHVASPSANTFKTRALVSAEENLVRWIRLLHVIRQCRTDAL